VPAAREHSPIAAPRHELEVGRHLANGNLARLLQVGDVSPVGNESTSHVERVHVFADDAPEGRERAKRGTVREIGLGRVVHEPVADVHSRELAVFAVAQLGEAAGHSAQNVGTRDDTDPRP